MLVYKSRLRRLTRLAGLLCADHRPSMATSRAPALKSAWENSSLKKAMLDTNDCFIVDNGTTIYAWTGKGCTATEKRSAMTHASDFVSSQGRPSFTQVVRVVETGEPAEFKALFKLWDPPFVMKGLLAASGSGVARAAEEKEVDIDALVSSTKKEDTAMYPDDGEVEKIGRASCRERV